MVGNKKWMRGQCWDLAIVLSERLAMPMAGLFDAHGNCHHAFVIDAENDKGLDARGWSDIEKLKLGCAGQEVRPLTRDDVERKGGWLGRPLEKSETAAALRFARAAGLMLKRADPNRLEVKVANPGSVSASSGNFLV